MPRFEDGAGYERWIKREMIIKNIYEMIMNIVCKYKREPFASVNANENHSQGGIFQKFQKKIAGNRPQSHSEIKSPWVNPVKAVVWFARKGVGYFNNPEKSQTQQGLRLLKQEDEVNAE